MLIPGVEVKQPQFDNEETGHELVTRLIKLHESKAKLNGDKKETVKRIILPVPGHPSAYLSSWKFNEFSYGNPDKPLPTDARGLFSYTTPETGRHVIVLRGYDKFFNTDEVAVTKWPFIESNTSGPYDLTLKQNGCIIFVGALDEATLLVSSKHSIGPRTDIGESHSDRGKAWLLKHLEKAGRKEAELAALLSRHNLTAVCELCDDDFEEHILAYPTTKAGLYLHGLNLNTPTFTTYPIMQVNKFAAYFGFLSNPHITLPDLHSLKALLRDCSKTGTYQGTEIEGFVIRTHIRSADFFFKYKFDEPYLLYRQWREITKALIAGHEPHIRLHHEITEEYIDFILPFIKNPLVAQQFNQNHGIIALRQKFLDCRGSSSISDSADSRSAITSETSNETAHLQEDRLVLVPIATIGCGKTTIALALQDLFGFGHIQNDNILAKKSSLLFAKSIYESFTLDNTRVVYADRNNHMFHERSSLVKDISALKKVLDPAIHFIAIAFDQSSDIRKFAVERVLKRGDNHQSIRAATMSPGQIEEIMDGFNRRFQALDLHKGPDNSFIEVVHLDPLVGSRKNLEVLCTFLHHKGVIGEMPSSTQLDNAIERAINYKPSVYKHMTSHASQATGTASGQTKKEVKKAKTNALSTSQKVNYFGLQVVQCVALVAMLDSLFEKHTELAPFWLSLKRSGRVQSEFHVTLIHESNKTSRSDIWEHYEKLLCPQTSPHLVKHHVDLDSVVFDHRVMAITVKIKDLPYTNKFLHITIGTANPTIKPVESNTMLAKPESSLTRIEFGESIECVLKAYNK